MKKLSIPCLLVCLCLFALSCSSGSPDNENREDGDKGGIAKEQIQLLCELVNEADDVTGAPQHEVYLQMAESKVKIADINNCEALAKESYAQYRIPDNAIAAVGGWWAGAGDYIYVVEEDGYFMVKKGEMFEEISPDSVFYETVVSYSKEGKLFND